ncbi:MAG: tetratricopeptide repeat protein [Deltaproteobacteria bacterium]|nr:tetratricopeptide repeat protein [Deltaproteobacteria bacterium]
MEESKNRRNVKTLYALYAKKRRGALSIILRRQDGASGGNTALALFIILISAAYLSYRYYGGSTPDKGPQPGALIGDHGREAAVRDIRLPAGARDTHTEYGPGLLRREELPPAAEEAVNDGDYNKASILIISALKDAPDSPQLKAALGAVLSRRAVAEYEKGNFPFAIELLKEAASYSKEPVIYRNLAIAQMKLGDMKGAAESLSAFAGDPEAKGLLKDIFVRLGNAADKGGDADEAAGYYTRALALDPADERLKAAVSALQAGRRGEAGMEKREAEHFRVRFEGGENSVAGHLIALLLEEAYVKVGADMGYYPDDKVEAVLYSKEQFRDVTSAASWAGAVYDGRIKIPAGGITERTDLLERVIFHEYSHAVVRRLSGGRAPVWLDEGIAQYEEGKDDMRYGGVLKGLVASGKISLRGLEASFMGFDKDKAETAYLASLSAVRYLIREFGMGQVRRVLDAIGRGRTVDSAFSEVIYLSYEDFERSWTASLGK